VGGQDRPDWRALGELAGLDVRTLRATCLHKRYQRGEVVFHEGDPGRALHLIDRGRVAVRLTTPLGDVATLDVLHAGDAFGEQALVDGAGERTATVTAIEYTDTLALDRAGFDRIRAEHPGVDHFVMMVLSARLRSTSRQLLDALYLPADTRVVRCVARMYAIFSTDSDGTIPLTQADIASMAGVTRSTANRVLKAAQAKGVLRAGRATLEILDVGRLQHLAGL
jgi:CRP-like cAMP-binding protein